MFETAVKILLEASEVYGIIVLGLHHTPELQGDFVDRVAKIAIGYRKPVVACDIGETEMALYIRSRFEKFGIPAYGSPEDAAVAMYALVKYGAYLKKSKNFEIYMDEFLKRRK
jgi:acyl-CoA synthetase (NDP forming)